ncbi:MNIO family bufferin maturase [Marinobacterium arenosum]|uniref:MNIO family bufferin maturase n=1 Tax=Marinobacterium arenosum TaxID=2862496 RepID=UPI001C94397F|nr:DUF692 domain-containing protein [Marinobacterium arenosum]MBY4675450.1 DUF692 domain-containing protein [Marinobacterium arenosum]
MMPVYKPWPASGVGIGLRHEHIQAVLAQKPKLCWMELLIDQHLSSGGAPLHQLEQIRHNYALTLHGTSLSLGGCDPLDTVYLQRVKKLARHLATSWLSEAVGFSSANGQFSHELLPLPYTEEALEHLCGRIRQAQDILGQRLLLANPARYLQFNHSTLSEGEFLAAMAERSDCELLVDLNNLYINEHNLGEPAEQTLTALPAGRVREIHLSGYHDQHGHLLGSHDSPVQPAVWQLFQRALELFGDTPTLVEWDQQLPPLERLLEEAQRARQLMKKVNDRQRQAP